MMVCTHRHPMQPNLGAQCRSEQQPVSGIWQIQSLPPRLGGLQRLGAVTFCS
jgi:hypothetical protein